MTATVTTTSHLDKWLNERLNRILDSASPVIWAGETHGGWLKIRFEDGSVCGRFVDRSEVSKSYGPGVAELIRKTCALARDAREMEDEAEDEGWRR